MSRLFYHVMQDNLGNLLFDVSGTMRIAGSGTLATIYGDEALTVILPNPMTNHPSFGSFKCYLGASAAGYDFYMAKSGYTFETLTGVQGLGTMAQQDANAVVITGGDLSGLLGVGVVNNPADNRTSFYTVQNAGGTNRWAVFCAGTAPSRFVGPLEVQAATKLESVLGVQATPTSQTAVTVAYTRSGGQWAIQTKPDSDSGGDGTVFYFANAAGTAVGSVTATGASTSFNTTSDARLKHAITPLTGALDVVRALRPVAFRWNADDSTGHGFLAHELQQVIPDAVTGEPDAVGGLGEIVPQQVDHSRLVPWLTAALQDTLAQVQALATRVSTLETQLGI